MGKKERRRGRKFIIAIVFITFVIIGAIAGALAAYLQSAPSLDEVTFDPQMTTFIYDVNGDILGRFYRENRTHVDLEDVPQIVVDAFLAAEDGDFYKHHGIDFSAIARAVIVNLKPGSTLQGGSTITQQVARLAFLTLDRTWSRKLKELLWTIQIERKYTKDEIMEAYLNIQYFGHSAYGIQAAAQTYFSKDISEVNLAEAAMLAGVVNGPGYFSPFYDMEAAVNRRNWVLKRMYDTGLISQSDYMTAVQTPIEVKDGRTRNAQAPYFVEYVRQQLLERYGEGQLYGGGLRVYTTFDPKLQKAAEDAIAAWVPTKGLDDQGLAQPQAAFVALDTQFGYIRAMIGGRGNDHFNRAVQATRQPGSAMKPFVFAAAIDTLRYTPVDIIVDEPTTFALITGETWSPTNYDGGYLGPVTLRRALEDSVNIVAAKVINDIGPGTVIEYAKRMGITTLVEQGRLNDNTLALSLGGLTRGVTPLEIARAYAVFANGGIRVEPIAILRVEDKDGNVIDEFRPNRSLVLAPETSYIMTDMLRGVIERGTGIGANIGRPAAGKTGTTSDFTDAWFVGYTPELVAAIWIGNDNNRPMVYPDQRIGSGIAARAWGAFMRTAMADMPVRDFAVPAGIVGPLTIDRETGGLVDDSCRNVPMEERLFNELFIKGTEPKNISPRCSALLTPPPGLFRRLP